MSENPLRAIQAFGQSIWQDDLRRRMILTGELQLMIEEDGLRGVTSNPAIFDKAISGSPDYDKEIRALALQGLTAEEIYQRLTIQDVQMAADAFRPLYDRSDGRHGFVSLEVNPHLARDVDGTLAEARRLWQLLDRPNVMIKVPGTKEGLICIRQLIAEGLNINVTLLFGLPRYQAVAEAYIGGLEDRAAAGRPLDGIASVASFFLSRIDVWVDPLLKKKMSGDDAENATAERIYGQTAIASAKRAYRIYNEVFESERFQQLQQRGARPQRLLWASTSTKEPEFSDIKYVEALIGADTINTLPPGTIAAYRDHGQPAERLTREMENAKEILEGLARLDINIDQVTQGLEDQGIEKFNKPFDSLMANLENARQAALHEPIDRMVILSEAHDAQIRNRIDDLQHIQFNKRMWQKDAALWPHEKAGEETIAKGMGWLTVTATMQTRAQELIAFRDELCEAGFHHVIHMGMGGSSLAPLVFQRSFATRPNGLTLHVLDTTDPSTLQDIENRVPLDQALFIVASKSGTTAEPLAFGDYFFNRLKELKGDSAGDHFAAVTDPGTPLADLARQRGFRRLFLNFEEIGGRYSALSYFGLLPAALMGLDVAELIVRAQRMVHACAADQPVNLSPGAVLGAALGELARQGRDKVTFIVPESLKTMGMWLEQLLAESTGKKGTGLLPVAGEPLGPPSFYSQDRVFVQLQLDDAPDERTARSVAALGDAGQPVIAIQLGDRMDVAQEFFRWEVATATAGAIIGINPFDQPNVQESKDNTNQLLGQVKDGNTLPEDQPDLIEAPFALSLSSGEPESTLARTLVRFLRQHREGDYLALLAYLSETDAIESLLNDIRFGLQQKFRAPVTAGYGPRYLHSTGQYHKGGPDKGLFIQLTCDDFQDLDIPDRPYSFGTLRRAQALGDFKALARHGRRVLRIHLGEDPAEALAQLKPVLDKALAARED